MTDEKIFYSISEVQRLTGLSMHVIRNGVKAGKIPYIMSGNKYLINFPLYKKILDKQSEGNIIT